MYTLCKWADELAPTTVSNPITDVQHTMIYVARGTATVNGRTLQEGESAYTEDALILSAGASGATVWRWGLRSDRSGLGTANGAGIASVLRMFRQVKMFEMVPTSKWLFRLDRIVNFEGTTGMHSHPGSGIRCLLSGSLRAESSKGENSYNNRRGDVWYEEGAYPLVSTVDAGDKTTFLRGMILPPEFLDVGETANWIGGFKAKFEAWDRLLDVVVNLR
jgi:hypothetical protein